jgi:FPC/CPF motif-containing protein YcgG
LESSAATADAARRAAASLLQQIGINSTMNEQEPTSPSPSAPHRVIDPPCPLFRVRRCGKTDPLLTGSEELGPAAAATASALRAFIQHGDYPCVGAKSALAKDACVFGTFDIDRELPNPQTADLSLTRALAWFGDSARHFDESYATFLAVFDGVNIASDDDFETFLWDRLQSLHDTDLSPWDPRVSAKTGDPDFRFSVGGHAFFIVGLHPAASREARRFPYPTLVFNLHAQFQQLRERGQFEQVRSTIRRREEALEGETNPYLDDFGERSEAHQYAGIWHHKGWRPPFERSPGQCPVKQPDANRAAGSSEDEYTPSATTQPSDQSDD